MCMDVTVDTRVAEEAEAAYHAGVIAAIDGLPFSAPDGPLMRHYQAGWDDGIIAAQCWSSEVSE